jgi:hypothetical protein
VGEQEGEDEEGGRDEDIQEVGGDEFQEGLTGHSHARAHAHDLVSDVEKEEEEQRAHKPEEEAPYSCQ